MDKYTPREVVGTSREGGRRSFDLSRKSFEISQKKEVEGNKVKILKELQDSLSHFKNEIQVKNTEFNNRQLPEDLAFLRDWQKMRVDELGKIELIEQSLPRILAEESLDIMEGIKDLGQYRISYDPYEHLSKIDGLYDAIKRNAEYRFRNGKTIINGSRET